MTERSTPRRAGHGVAVALLTAAGLIGWAPAAAAHVAVDSARPNGDGTTTVTLAWNHSCTPDGVTIGVDVAAGPGVTFVGAATGIAGWTFSVNPAAVTFTGPGVPTGEQVSVDVVARIDGAPGATITFPSIQRCGDQQSAWTDPDPTADHPVPSLVATAAVLAPEVVVESDSGAGITQVLTGIVGLAASLGLVGFLVQRRAGRL